MTHTVTLIPGDGIGPDVTTAARRALEATGVSLAWDVRALGTAATLRGDGALPADTLASIRRTGVALKGPIATPPEEEIRSANVQLRMELGLFAGVRPCRWMPGVASRYEGVDIVVIRENTEGMYTGIEFEMGAAGTRVLLRSIAETTGTRIRRDAGVSVKSISEHASERIARFAFAYARAHGRRTVTAGHKANIMKASDGIFLEACRRVAEEHPDIGFEERIVDALAMQLVQGPRAFDVLVLPNLYGDLVSELCAGLVGGPGAVPAVDLGPGVAVFGTLHGTAPRLVGTGRADPTAMLLAGALLLRHVGEPVAAARLEHAVAGAIADGEQAEGTIAMTDAVVAGLTGGSDGRVGA